jgi:hypothetical protein
VIQVLLDALRMRRASTSLGFAGAFRLNATGPVKVRDEELVAVPLERHEFHGEWNYTLYPAA